MPTFRWAEATKVSNPSIGETHLFQRWNDIIYIVLGIGNTLSNAEDELI
jgi:hypothetical protein